MSTPTEGWHGWDAYARFYDWENAQTVGRRDVRFWADLAGRAPGVELCGASYRGVGIPACIRQGDEAARRVLDRLTS